MLYPDTIITKVLNAREKRAELRNKFANNRQATISLTFNIPGYPKHNKLTDEAYQIVLDDLKRYLYANRIFIDTDNSVKLTDNAGHIFIASLPRNINLVSVKAITEQFEIQHPLNRIIDVDIFNEEAKPVSSLKQKSCIICKNKPAVECMRLGNHSYLELQTVTFRKINDFVNEQKRNHLIAEIEVAANRALLYEVSLTPKPGLVNQISSGAHSDMNYYTFLNSASVLAVFWREFAKAGFDFNGDISEALPQIREIGIKAEQAMYQATSGINTHKGLIFIFGVSIFSTAFLLKTNNELNQTIIQETIKRICLNIVEEELASSELLKTHGEKTYKKYGMQGAGVRLEAQNGFPIVFNLITEFLKEKLKQETFYDQNLLNEILLDALLRIMSCLNDSNIIYRAGLEKLNYLKQLASSIVKGEKEYSVIHEYCLKENISPGGSADMLAVALFFTFLNHKKIIVL